MRIIATLILLSLVIVVSGCTTIPSECPDMGYSEYENTNIDINNSSQALEVMKSYIQSKNIVFYNSIKDLVSEDLEYKEIDTISPTTKQISKIYAWVIVENKGGTFAIDNTGTIYEKGSCL